MREPQHTLSMCFNESESHPATRVTKRSDWMSEWWMSEWGAMLLYCCIAVYWLYCFTAIILMFYALRLFIFYFPFFFHFLHCCSCSVLFWLCCIAPCNNCFERRFINKFTLPYHFNLINWLFKYRRSTGSHKVFFSWGSAVWIGLHLAYINTVLE